MAKPEYLILTCEHGGNAIPPGYRAQFKGQEATLKSHRGFDWGALEVARQMARQFSAPLHFTQVSRLLVDLNRYPRSKTLFSEFTRDLEPDVKRGILDRHYFPFRNGTEAAMRDLLKSGGTLLHLSIHSFTPVWKGVARKADIGLLYDPRRSREKTFCSSWETAMKNADTPFVIRRNNPYLGRADGFATYLRRQFPGSRYIGIELEMNRKHVESDAASWRRLKKLLLDSLGDVLISRDVVPTTFRTTRY